MIDYFSQSPIVISVVLYRSNYLDNRIISTIKNKASILFKSNDLITISSNDLLDILVEYFEKEITETSVYSPDKMYHNINSAYQLYSTINYYSKLMIVNLRISNQMNFSRVNEAETGKYISLDIKIDKCLVNFDKVFTKEELKLFNKLLVKIGMIEGLYNKNYYNIKTSEFFNIINSLDDTREFANILDKISTVLNDRVKNDDPHLILITDNLLSLK